MGLALLGGALQGVGQGIYEIGKMNALERFEQYKEARLAERRKDEMETQARLNDTNDANSQLRKATYDKDSDLRAAIAAVGLKKVENEGGLTLEQLGARNNESLERLKSKLNMTETQARLAQEYVNALSLAGIELAGAGSRGDTAAPESEVRPNRAAPAKPSRSSADRLDEIMSGHRRSGSARAVNPKTGRAIVLNHGVWVDEVSGVPVM